MTVCLLSLDAHETVSVANLSVSAVSGNCLLKHGTNLCRGNPIRFACAYTEPKTAPLVFAILGASNALDAACIFVCPNSRYR